MLSSSKIFFVIGLIFLCLTIINSFSTYEVTPTLQRAEILAGISSVLIILISLLWSELTPKKAQKEITMKKQGFVLDETLDNNIKKEIAWGSNLLLTATPAGSISLYWNGSLILQRGIIGKREFEPGPICKRAAKTRKLISLANTKVYPGSDEFAELIANLPSVIIYPLADNGWLILGGCSERCFSKSDEKWISGWAEKITQILLDG